MSARKRLCPRRDARAHRAIVSGNRPTFDADIRRMTLRAGQDPSGVFETETARDSVDLLDSVTKYHAKFLGDSRVVLSLTQESTGCGRDAGRIRVAAAAVVKMVTDPASRRGRSTIRDKEGAMTGRWVRQRGICVGLAAVIIAAWVVLPALADAAATPEYRWRVGSAWTQKTRNESVTLFTELANKYSNGRIQIKFQHSGLLGTHDELFHAVREGSVEMAVISPYVNLVPGTC